MFKFKIHQLDNFKLVQKVCNEAMINNLMIGVIAPPGIGKTFSLNYFTKTNHNVFYIELGKSVTSKEMYNRILNSIKNQNTNTKKSVTEILREIKMELENNGSKNLIIIDEAGMFNKSRLSYFHELRNLTLYNCGIVISGPKNFEKNIIDWVQDEIEGVEEFYSRVSYWANLNRPTNAEIKAIFKNENLGKTDMEKTLLTNILKSPYEKRSWRKIEMLIQRCLFDQELSSKKDADKTTD